MDNNRSGGHPTPDYRKVLDEALAGTLAPAVTASETKILDATLELVGRFGEHRITIDDIAGEAGLSRMTVFRRFKTKDAVIAETYIRESRRAVQAIQTAADTASDGPSALVESYVRLVEICRDSPILSRLSRDEPEGIVRLFRDGEPSGLQLVSSVLYAMATRPDQQLAAHRRELRRVCDELALACFADVLATTDPGGRPRAARIRSAGLVELLLRGA